MVVLCATPRATDATAAMPGSVSLEAAAALAEAVVLDEVMMTWKAQSDEQFVAELSLAVPRVARAVQAQSFRRCWAAELVPCGAASALVRPAAIHLSASKMDRADCCAHYEASADRESWSSAPPPSLALRAQVHWQLA